MKVLCVFGEHQYGVRSRGIGIEYAAFIPALRRLGHDVIHFESLNKSCYANFAELNKALLHVVDQEKPDVLLAVQMQYELWLETLQIIRNRGRVATICWSTDDSWKYKETSRFIGSSYHAMTTTYSDIVPQYHRDGIPHVLLTQWAARSETLHEPLPARSCRYQVTFIGAAHGDRMKRIAKLRSLGLEVTCFGHGWPAGPIDAEEIPKIMRESVISLNFANSKGENQIKARTFEVPGAGGFLLTESAPGIEKYYEINKEIVVFYGLEDLTTKAKHFLTHVNERDAIAFAGYQRTKKEHIYDLRMKETLEFALQSRDEWLKKGLPQHGPSFEQASKKHRVTLPLKLLRTLLILPCNLMWGRMRGPRAARRILFELSWRFIGAKTYTSAGVPGRLFYNES